MALINCSECSKEISSQAGSCPHCGVPLKPTTPAVTKQKSTQIATGIFWIVVIGFFIYFWNLPSDGKVDGGKQAAANAAPQAERLKPEQVIRFPKSRFACLTQEKYKEAALHAVRKEETKFDALFEKLDCFALPTDVDFKILSIDSHLDYDIIEIVNASSTKSNGAFTEWDYKK